MGFMATVILLALSGLPGSGQAEIDDSPAREHAIAQLRELQSAYFNKGQPDGLVEDLSLVGSDVTDAVMDLLNELPEIRVLQLFDTRVTHVGLRRLEHLAELQELSLGRAQINDEMMETVGALAGLRELELRGTRVTCVGLRQLRRLTRLRKLRLEGVQVNDEMMETVGALTGLQRLELTDTRVTDVGIRRLRSLTELKVLLLDGVEITDEGLSTLSSLKHLETLVLRDMRIHGTGLNDLGPLIGLELLLLEGPLETVEGLTSLKGLRELWLCDTGVTDAGFEPLRRIPNLERLVLNGETFTDRKLDALPGFPRLKKFGVSCVDYQLSDSAAERFRKGIQGVECTGDTCGGANLSRARRAEELERRHLLRHGISGRIRLAWRSAVRRLW